VATPLDKSALRARLRSLRRRLAAAAPDAALTAAGRLPLERLPRFSLFSGYQALGAEMDARPLMARLAETGAAAALPYAAHRDEPLTFRRWAPDAALAPDAFGIPAPAVGEAVAPDLVIAPLLAFDRKGGRLGQGAGHYDRTLANLRALKPVFVLGLGYAGQEVAEIPLEAHDQRLDAILTETEYIEVG
jgi:5-formyltetrahydrofolate cyclo-ligase